MAQKKDAVEKDLRFSHFTIERAPDAVFWINSRAEIHRVNETACKHLSYSQEELTSMTVHEIDPNYGQHEWPQIRSKIKKEKILTFETIHRTKIGELIPVEVTTNYIEFDGEGYTCSFARNITRRKKAEQALRESENRYRNIYDNTPVMMHSIGADIKIINVNNHWLKTLGYKRNEVIGRMATDFLTKESRRYAAEIAIPKLLKTGSVKDIEYQMIKKNGDVIDVQLSSNAEFDKKGEMIHSLAFIVDVTKRKKAERALQYRLAIEKLISEISTYFINLSWEEIDAGIDYALKRMGVFAGVDRSYLFLLFDDGKKSKNLNEWCAKGVVPQIDKLQNVSMVEEIPWVSEKIQKMDPVYVPKVSELTDEAKAEKIHWGEQDIKSLLTVPLVFGGSVIGFLGFDSVKSTKIWMEEDVRLLRVAGEIIANSLNRKEAEEALQVNRARLQGIITTAMDAIITMDDDMKIILCNEAAEKVFHCKASSVVGQTVNEFLSEKFRALLKNYMNDRASESDMWVPSGLTAIRKNGDEFPIEATLSRVKVLNQNLFTIILRDVDERDRVEKELAKLQNQNIYLREELKSEFNFGEIIGTSKPIQKVFQNIEMVATTDSTVLLLGETGTGKELIARAIHNLSTRNENVMIKVNCGALPSGLVESELFGHEKGAFTGATNQKKGRFELANNGTIFLDEVSELSKETQTKLLRVLQEQEFERVGGSETLKVNVRVIAATNRNLEKEVEEGAFRADLFYRLNIFPMQVPPLRERKEDISLLANYFVQKFSGRMGKQISSINQNTLEKLKRLEWQGNVRELGNILERAVIFCQGRVLQEKHIDVLNAPRLPEDEFTTLEEAERRLILRTLEKTGGILSGPQGAAKLLGVNRSTLWSRMRKLGINVTKQVAHN